jgi:N4-(beta-N-acetylglucosaminyl)-L-asparaginase
MPISRRDLLRGSAAAAAAAGLTGEVMAQQSNRTQRGPGGPAVIASANGVRSCNRAMELMRQGHDPLDAVIEGVRLVEDDAEDHSVGLGGLPNEDGVVELDSCVMHGPMHKAGGVAALQRIRNPSQVARVVMQRTDHVLLVGEGALRFARAHGFQEEDLLTDEARRIWLKWKETHSDNDDWIHPEASEESARRLKELGIDFTYGTINCCALTTGGDLAGVTTTSGLSYKIAGRVGDSPIIGAGLYVDNDVGAAGSTGRGEANLQNLSSFMVVEFMRGGMPPQEACIAVLKRVAAKTEKRLRNQAGEPNYSLKLYALRKDGLTGGAGMRGESQMAVHDGTQCRLIPIPGLYGE